MSFLTLQIQGWSRGVFSYSCCDEKSLNLASKAIYEKKKNLKFSRYGLVLLNSHVFSASEHTGMLQLRGNVIFLICGEAQDMVLIPATID